MTATAAQIARTANDWGQMAGEAVTVEQIGNAIYGFCSELGALRILKRYRTVERATAEYSQNLGKWFFCIEMTA